MSNSENKNINNKAIIDETNQTENTTNVETPQNEGAVNISDEVVAVISSKAAAEVKGVAGMVGGVAGGFAELLGMKNLTKGVRTVREGNSITIYLSVMVNYGTIIPDVSWNLQTKVKADVEAMTGLEVKGVNVSVDGISLNDDETESVNNTEAVKEEA